MCPAHSELEVTVKTLAICLPKGNAVGQLIILPQFYLAGQEELLCQRLQALLCAHAQLLVLLLLFDTRCLQQVALHLLLAIFNSGHLQTQCQQHDAHNSCVQHSRTSARSVQLAERPTVCSNCKTGGQHS